MDEEFRDRIPELPDFGSQDIPVGKPDLIQRDLRGLSGRRQSTTGKGSPNAADQWRRHGEIKEY